MRFSSIDRRDFAKTNQISKRYNVEWKRFAGRSCIGDCSNLFQRLKPTSYYDFYMKYTEDGEKTKHDRKTYRYYGRTEDEITELAKQYMASCKDTPYTLDEYIKNVYMHTIIETFDGQKREEDVIKYLLGMGFTYEKPRTNEDSKFGIDFKVFNNIGLQFVLQIKPISFFKGKSNQSLITDRKNAFHKESLVQKYYNVPAYYLVYQIDCDGTVKWLTENNRICFKLSRLCDKETGFPYDNIPKNMIEI